MANPDKEEYRQKIKTFVDNIFTEILNKTLIKEMVKYGKKIIVVKPELIKDTG